jgi:hypothetical protein
VKDWLSRRRGTSNSASEIDDDAKPKTRPSIRLTEKCSMGQAVGRAGGPRHVPRSVGHRMRVVVFGLAGRGAGLWSHNRTGRRECNA